MKVFFLFILNAHLCSCVSGPSLKDKVSYLNGDHYKGASTATAGGIPLHVTTKESPSLITGKLVSKKMKSSNGINVSLLKENKALGSVNTNRDGSFKFKQNLKNGSYKIKFKGLTEAFILNGYEANMGSIIY